MKIAIKKTDIDKIDLKEIEKSFKAHPIGEIDYNSSELTKQLNEVIFEFDYLGKETLIEYLKQHHITGRIFS